MRSRSALDSGQNALEMLKKQLDHMSSTGAHHRVS
jgi:hypothetical protein